MATAASTAVPPAAITSAPIFDAISFCDATMPFWARVGTETAEVVSEKRAHAAMTSGIRRYFMARIIRGRDGPSLTRRSTHATLRQACQAA